MYRIYGIANTDFPTREAATAWAFEQIKAFNFDELTIGKVVTVLSAVDSNRGVKVKDVK